MHAVRTSDPKLHNFSLFRLQLQQLYLTLDHTRGLGVRLTYSYNGRACTHTVRILK